jgi:hypothetical protein
MDVISLIPLFSLRVSTTFYLTPFVLCPHPMTIHIPIGPTLQDIFSPSGPLCTNPEVLPSARLPLLRKAQTRDLLGLQEVIQEKHHQELLAILIPTVEDPEPRFVLLHPFPPLPLIHDTHLLITPPATPSFGTQSPLPRRRRPNKLMRRRHGRHPPLPQPHRRVPPEAPGPCAGGAECTRTDNHDVGDGCRCE